MTVYSLPVVGGLAVHRPTLYFPRETGGGSDGFSEMSDGISRLPVAASVGLLWLRALAYWTIAGTLIAAGGGTFALDAPAKRSQRCRPSPPDPPLPPPGPLSWRISTTPWPERVRGSEGTFWELCPLVRPIS